MSDSRYFKPLDVVAEVEPEFVSDPDGTRLRTRDVTTVFMAAPRCVFRCLHCDLHRFALPERASEGSAVAQVEFALAQIKALPLPRGGDATQSLPRGGDQEALRQRRGGEDAGDHHTQTSCSLGPLGLRRSPATLPRWVKLYNGGNFTDPRSIPTADRDPIARRVASFDRVVVENHPRLPQEALWRFAEQISGRLEVAMGLETADPQRLALLKKQMTVADYQHACQQLIDRDIDVRTFIVVGGLGTDAESWQSDVERSMDAAWAAGSRHVSLILMRHSLLDRVKPLGISSPTITLPQLESAFIDWLSKPRPKCRVLTLDTWELGAQGSCSQCTTARLENIEQMNLRQTAKSIIACEACGGGR